MTREIKFRCWDKIQGKMFEPSSLSWKNGTMWVCDSHGENKLEYEIVHPNAEVMQFTGLKDKNGKEIFEGDIIRTFDTRTTPLYSHGVINWKAGAFIISQDDRNDREFLLFPSSTSFEIIGDIYSTPELLTPKK